MDEATWSDSLTRLMQAREAQKLILPPLKDEPGYLEKLARKFFEWLAVQLPTGVSPKLIVPFFKIILITAGVVLLGVVVWALSLSFRNATRRIGGAAGQAPAPVPPPVGEDFLMKLYLEASGAQRWPEAARLRWKIFLMRTDLAPSLTPLEHLREPASYRLMFGYGDDDFAGFVTKLEELEAHAR